MANFNRERIPERQPHKQIPVNSPVVETHA